MRSGWPTKPSYSRIGRRSALPRNWMPYMSWHSRSMKAAEPFGIQLLGVTVLTSMEAVDLIRLGYRLPSDGVAHDLVEDGRMKEDVRKVTLSRALFGAACGLSGFVCSPGEVSLLKAEFPDGFFLVPGIRPAGANIGDQKRVGTPLQAVRDGASLIVVGRPIRDAEYPEEAAKDILREIGGNFP